jgi:Pro-kumamolisin, activation domain/Bacterial Ig-like domain (group 3)
MRYSRFPGPNLIEQKELSMRGTSLPRLLFTFAVYVVGLAGIGVPVASAAVQNRINVAISRNNPIEIPNSVHPKVGLANDLGPAQAETKLVGMTLRFSMTADQEAALDQLLADLQNPASPRYHQWLTPAQFGAQFGLSSADLAKVKDWLTGQGFTVTGVANGGLFVTFDGTVAQAQAAFGTSIHSLSLDGVTHFANVTNASVPMALSGVVGGITGLHDFRLKPHVHTSVANPRFTSSVSGSHYLSPSDIYTIYDVNPLLTAGINGAGIGTGTNCHSVGTPQPTCGDIAVMGQVDISTTDVSAFRAASGLSTTNLPTTVPEGGDPGVPTCSTNNCSPNDGDLAESSLDVEWSGAMAPSASILFVNGPDVLYNATTQAIDLNLAPIITLSYGNCEAAWGSTAINSLNLLFKQANAQGQTILAATGDLGAADCDNGTSAIEGMTVDFPASSPYVTGMGGTMFNGDLAATGSGTTWAATQYWAGTSGSDVISSALLYIPETTWNENSATSTGFSAGGGGVSAFFTKPAWQVETGPAGGLMTQVVADASRDLPDLALDAAAGHDQYLYCAQGSCASGYRVSAGGNLTVAGGTSFDSQIFGGMLALIEQKTGSRIGNANPVIYALGNSTAYYNTTNLSVFHDVTTGNNSDPCTAGTPNCQNGGTLGYSAGVGYDLATGWGSVDLKNLANAWQLVTPLGVGSLGTTASATTLVASTTTPAAGATVTLTATVTGSNGTPTGTVQFLVNNTLLGSPVTLTNGVATYSYVTSCSTLGQQMLSAAYSGDATYSGSKGPALSSGSAGNSGGAGVTSNGSIITAPLIVNVSSGTCPDFTVTPSQSTVSVAAGGTIPAATITVAPANSFTGTVAFTATSTTQTAYSPTLTFSPASVAITSSASGTTSLTFTGITAGLQMPKMPGHTPSRAPWYEAGSGVTIASLLMFALPRKRRLGGLLAVLLAVALIGGATGCSSSQAGPPATVTNPYAGTYVVTVIGTYTSSGKPTITHSSTITYQIN